MPIFPLLCGRFNVWFHPTSSVLVTTIWPTSKWTITSLGWGKEKYDWQSIINSESNYCKGKPPSTVPPPIFLLCYRLIIKYSSPERIGVAMNYLRVPWRRWNRKFPSDLHEFNVYCYVLRMVATMELRQGSSCAHQDSGMSFTVEI